MSDFTFLNQYRERLGPYATEDSDRFRGRFRLTIKGMRVIVLASDGMGWKHVSVSLRDYPHTTPSWEMMCEIKDLFWEPQDWVIQFHPAKSEYVNTHPGCLHLWQPTHLKFPTPKSILVGFKTPVPA